MAEIIIDNLLKENFDRRSVNISGTTTADATTASATATGGTTAIDAAVKETFEVPTEASATASGGTGLDIVLNVFTETAKASAEGAKIETDVIGTDGDVDVLIEGKKIAAYTNIELKKRLNEVDTFKFEAFIEDNDDRALIQEGNIVKFVEGYNDLLFKGVLNEVEYKSSFRAVCEGNGMEQKLLNRKTDRETFTNSSGDAIVKDVVPTSVISRGVIESAPQVSVRFDHDNLARAVAGVANATGYDWYVDQEKGDGFDEDFLNFEASAGSDKVKETYKIGNNARLIERNKDQGFIANDITLLGRGDGINQLEANVFAASTDFTDSTEQFSDSFEGYSTQIIKNREKITLFNDSEYNVSVAEDGSHLITAQASSNDEDKIRSYRLDDKFNLDKIELRSVESPSFEPYDVKIANGGKTLYVTTTAGSGQEIKQFTLADAYDVTTASLDGTITTNLDTAETVVTISNNGKNLAIGDNQGNVRNYPFNSAYDITDLDTANITVNNLSDSVTGIDFSDAGDKLFINDFGTIKTFKLSTQFDVSTASKIDERTTTEGDYVFEWRDNGRLLFLSQRDVFNAGDVTKNFAGKRNLKVDDATQLGNVGDEIIARAGVENLRANILDSTTLSVVDRGLQDFEGNETQTPDHYKGVRVFLKENITQGVGPFTPENRSTAQTGSSIDKFGVREQRETDKTITDLRTLEKAADIELKNRFEDIFRVQIKPTEPRTTKRIELGDTVKAEDLTAMDVEDTFQVTGIDAQRASAGEGTTLHLANRPRRLTERLRDIESNTDTLNAHMQGATNLAPLNFRDNADNSNPIIADLYVPEDAVAVNKVDVKAKRQSFRGFVKANTTSSNSETGEYENSLQVTATENTFLNPPQSIKADVPASPTGTDTGIVVTAAVFNQDSSSKTYDFTITNETTGTTLDTRSNVTLDKEEGQTFNFQYDASQASENDSIKFELTGDDIVTQDNFKNSYMELSVSSKSNHQHNLLGEQDFGIFQPGSEPDVDVDVVVDGNTVTTVSNVSVGDEIGPIDVQPNLDTPLAGEYHEIKLVPKDTGGGNNGRSRFTVDVNGKIFIESTLQ